MAFPQTELQTRHDTNQNNCGYILARKPQADYKISVEMQSTCKSKTLFLFKGTKLKDCSNLLLRLIVSLQWSGLVFVFCFVLFFCLFAISWATPAAYGGSQAGGSNRSCSHRPTPEPQQQWIRAASATYTTAQGSTGSLTHWARAGIEPTTSWFLVGFVNHWAMTGTPGLVFVFKR